MRVLVVNTGSSSLKLRLLGPDDEVLADDQIDRWAEGDAESIAERLRDFDPPDAVGHRVVHGGDEFRGPVRLDADIEERLAALTPLAPIHQPRAVAGIRAVGEVLPGLPAVAAFDTAYHSTLEPAAATYAVPLEWRERFGLRRFGFHGLSHAYAARRAASFVASSTGEARVVTCHLGAGASLCASRGERSIDTTMGFTPLEGLVMATRSGSVDPGMVLWLVTEAGLSPVDVERGLRDASGLAGLAGGSGDMRDVLSARAQGDPRAELAFDVYMHRLVQEVAAMSASLGGLDALVFTGGVGEHVPEVRERAAAGLAFLGVGIDPEKNSSVGDGDTEITGVHATVATFVVEAREDLEIARAAREVLAGGAAPAVTEARPGEDGG